MKVSVYYETLCPDSIAFIRNQLWPAHGSVGEIMDIDLIPYGKAAVRQLLFCLSAFHQHAISFSVPFMQYEENGDNSVSFRCQHGSRECYGKLQKLCLPFLAYLRFCSFISQLPSVSIRSPGNMVQACALQQISNVTQVLSLVNCMESQRFPDRAGQKVCLENGLRMIDAGAR